MGDEVTPVGQQDGGNADAVVATAGAGPDSIRDIVDSLGFDGTPDAVTPAPEPAASGTGEGDSATPKTVAPPEAPKVEFYSEEQLDKFQLKDYENPSFDWSKVPPERAKAVKAAIALVTPERQRLAEARREVARKAAERTQEPPQPTEETEEQRQERTNREIVATHLKELTGVSDPQVLGQMAENLIFTQAVEIANVPEYSSDENFLNAVNAEIAQHPMLLAAAETRNPEIIAQAIQFGAQIVRAKNASTASAQLEQRAKDLDAREKALKEAETELEQERAKVTRSRPTISGGAPAGATPKASTNTVRDVVDELDVDWSHPLR